MKYALWLVAVVASLGAMLTTLLRTPHEQPARPPSAAAAPSLAEQGASRALSAPISRPLRVSVEEEPVRPNGTTESTSGTISGTVADAGGEPLAGVTCRILNGSPPTGLTGLVSRPRQPAKIFAQCASDERGAFSFAVPEGFWTLRLEARGRAPWEEAHLIPGDVRWVRLRAARPRSVRVLDAGGRPVSGAEVRLLRGEFGDPESAHQVLRADSGGEARIDSVPAGSWFVQAAHPDFVTRRVPLSPPGPGPLQVVLTRGLRIEGRVSTGDGRSLDGAEVHFETSGGFVTSHSVPVELDGRYASAIAFPPGGALELAVVARGFGEVRRVVRLGRSPERGAPGSGTHEHGGSDVIRGPGSAGDPWVQREDFVLESPDRSVIGRIVDREGGPVAGAEVWLRALESLPPETVVPIPDSEEILAGGLPDLSAFDPKASAVARLRYGARTDEVGAFRVDGLHPRRAYSLLVLSAAHSNAALWVAEGAPGEVADLGTTALAAAGRLWGHVRREDGRPLEGVLVYAVGWKTNAVVPGSEFRTSRPGVRAAGLEAITNGDGYFAIEPFPPAEFRLYYAGSLTETLVLESGQELGGLELVVPDGEAKVPVTLTVVDTLGVPVPQAYASLAGVPHGHPRGEPLPYDYGTWEAGPGDSEGRIRLSARPGRYEVEVKDLQGLLTERVFRFDLEREGIERKVVLLTDPAPPGRLEGQVRSARGGGIAGVEVSWIPTTGATSCGCLKTRVVTDERGRFSFGPVLRGAHRLVVRDPNDRFAPTQLYPARPGPPLEILME